MQTEENKVETEVEIEDTELQETETIEVEENEESQEDTEESTEVEDESSDEVLITIDDGESPAPEDKEEAPTWVKDLRKKHREAQKENRELKKKLEEQSKPQEAVRLRAKPTLEGSDFDSDVYEKDLDSWYEEKKEHDVKQAEVEATEKQQQQAWQDKLNSYEEAKKSIKVADFEEAEFNVQDSLNITQQGIIIQGADNPAHIVAALGNNQSKLQELAEIKDPVKFAFAVSKLESKMKVTSRKAPPPEKKVIGTGAGKVDTQLKRLEEEADKSGDRTALIQYKQKLKRSKTT